MKRTILHNTSAYVWAGMIPYLLGFVMLPVYTRVLDRSDYGVLTLVNTFSAFLLCAFGAQLSTSLGRFWFDEEGAGRRDLFSTVLWGVVGINSILILLAHSVGPWLARALFSQGNIVYRPHVMLALGTVFCTSTGSCGAWLLRAQERGGRVLGLAAIHTCAMVGTGLWLVVWQQKGAVGMLTSVFLSSFLHMAGLLWSVREWIGLRFDGSRFRRSIGYSLPMIPHTLGAVVFVYSDKLMLDHFGVSLAAIGLYGIADRIAMILRLGVNAFNDAVAPSFVKLSKRDKREAVKMYHVLMARWGGVIALAYLGMALFSEEALWILVAEPFRDAYGFLPILLGAYIFRGLYCFAVNPVLFERKTGWIPWITAAAAATNIGLNVWLIPRHGAVAAAWTTLFSYAVYFATALVMGLNVYPQKYPWRVWMRTLLPLPALMWFVSRSPFDGAGGVFVWKILLFSGFLVWLAVWNDEGVFTEIIQKVRRRLGRMPPMVLNRSSPARPDSVPSAAEPWLFLIDDGWRYEKKNVIRALASQSRLTVATHDPTTFEHLKDIVPCLLIRQVSVACRPDHIWRRLLAKELDTHMSRVWTGLRMHEASPLLKTWFFLKGLSARFIPFRPTRIQAIRHAYQGSSLYGEVLEGQTALMLSPVSLMDKRLAFEASASGLKLVSWVYSWDNPMKEVEYLSEANWHLVWNDTNRDDLVKYHRVERERVIPIGPVQFDDYVSWVGTPSKRVEQDYVLFACSMGLPFYIEQEVRMIRFLRECLDAISPSTELRIRPYPFCVEETPYQAVRNLRGVRVLDYGDFHAGKLLVGAEDIRAKFDQINNARIMVHMGSTIALEASLTDTPVLFPLFSFAEGLPDIQDYRHVFGNEHLRQVIRPEFPNFPQTPERFREVLSEILHGQTESYAVYNQFMRHFLSLSPLQRILPRFLRWVENNLDFSRSP